MTNSKDLDRSKVTFSQAEGLEPLPRPLQLGEMPREFRSIMWSITYEFLKASKDGYNDYSDITGSWRQILYEYHVLKLHEPADEYDPIFCKAFPVIKKLMLNEPYNKVIDFLQFVMRHRLCPDDFGETVQSVLMSARMAYTVTSDGTTIIPAATQEEGAALQTAFATLKQEGFDGASIHLRKSVDQLNNGNYAECVRESIHAVESVARVLDPKASTLGPALTALERGEVSG